MDCLRCGKVLDDFCWDCREEMIGEAIAKANAKKHEEAKKYVMVEREEYDRMMKAADISIHKIMEQKYDRNEEQDGHGHIMGPIR
jgi:hypothetical protein